MQKTQFHKTLALVLFISTGITGCGNSSKVMNAEYRTLGLCLKAIEENSGMSLEIVTDKPDNVSGFLSNGEAFGCQRKSSGTKGIYYHAWFYVDK